MNTLNIAKVLIDDPNAPLNPTNPHDIPSKPNNQALLQFDLSFESQTPRVLAFPKMFYGVLAPMIKLTLINQGFHATQKYSWDDKAVEMLQQTMTENGLHKYLPSNLHLENKHHVFFICSNITDSDYSRLLIHILSQPTDPNIVEQVRVIEQTVPNKNTIETC